jgi:hypothetical protein
VANGKSRLLNSLCNRDFIIRRIYERIHAYVIRGARGQKALVCMGGEEREKGYDVLCFSRAGRSENVLLYGVRDVSFAMIFACLPVHPSLLRPFVSG